MAFYWVFLFPAVLAAVCSDRLDRAFRCGGTLKKTILVFCAAVVLIVLTPAAFLWL